MGDRKIIAILIIILALVVMIGLVYFMFFSPVGNETPSPVATTTPTETLTSVNKPVDETKVTQRRVVSQTVVTAEELKKISAAFVERYGTYSNQSGYQNIKELDVFMSNRMQTWALQYIQQAERNHPNTDIYYGITTKAVVIDTLNFSDEATTASFRVQTQRVEAIGSTSNERRFQQDATVGMVKEAGIWKVDKVTWEN